MGLLLPALGATRQAGQQSVCASNLRQLVLGNTAYADDHEEHFVPAAEDIFERGGGLKRWHGTRADPRGAFKASRGPLARYLGAGTGVRQCPALPKEQIAVGFEAGNGGYGYNRHYLGGRADLFGFTPRAARTTAATYDIMMPSQTVMFCDTAFLQGRRPRYELIEYSFCEPPMPVGLSAFGRLSPSIHFRHLEATANVGWADGHVDPQPMTFTDPPDNPVRLRFGLGWFGPQNNAWFDLN